MVTLFLFVDVLASFVVVVVVVVALLPKYLCRTEYMLNKPIPQSCTVATLILILQVKNSGRPLENQTWHTRADHNKSF